MAISTIGQNGLQQSRILTAVQQPAGAVLQVVQTFDSSSTGYFSTTTTGSMVATGFSVSITPLFSTSKVLILLSGNMYMSSAGSYGASIYRNSTNLSTGNSPSGFNVAYISSGTSGGAMNLSVLDSPATTSATTYQVYIAGTAGTTYFGNPIGSFGGRAISLIAMEIAA